MFTLYRQTEVDRGSFSFLPMEGSSDSIPALERFTMNHTGVYLVVYNGKAVEMIESHGGSQRITVLGLL